MIAIGVFQDFTASEIFTTSIQFEKGESYSRALRTLLDHANMPDPSMMIDFLVVDGDNCEQPDISKVYAEGE